MKSLGSGTGCEAEDTSLEGQTYYICAPKKEVIAYGRNKGGSAKLNEALAGCEQSEEEKIAF